MRLKEQNVSQERKITLVKLLKLTLDILHSLLWDCSLTQKREEEDIKQLSFTLV